MTVTPPRAVLFDWDNTLVDTWPCIHAALERTFDAMGHQPWTFEETRTRVARSLRDSFPGLFGDRWEEARDLFYGHFRALHLEMLTVLPGAEAMLDALAEEGLYMAVVSNKTGVHLRTEVEHLGWGRFFGRVVGATDALRDKPAPDPVVMALGADGGPTGPDVWFVGDTAVDLECAHAAGCTPVLLRAEPPGETEFESCAPSLYFPGGDGLTRAVRSHLARHDAAPISQR